MEQRDLRDHLTRSLALEMAERLGLPAAVVRDARARRDDKEQQAEDLRAEAEAASAIAVDANQTGDNYVLTTVLFASVLFFAGISTKFSGYWVRVTLVVLAFLAFLSGTVLLLTFPVQ